MDSLLNDEKLVDLHERMSAALARLQDTDDLLGEVLATMAVNRDHDQLPAAWYPFIDRWITKYERIRATDF